MKKDVVLITGNFNVLHPGHIRLFKFAKNLGGTLIVGVFSDKLAGQAINITEELRIEALASIEIIDEVLLIQDSLENFIKKHKPHIVVKGKEYENKINLELSLVEQYGGKLIFSSGEIGITSLETSGDGHRIPYSAQKIINSFMLRHNISLSRLQNLLDSFSEKNICVIGDTIVDEYIDCFALGMSQEEPSLVVSPQQTKKFLGGAGIVASHAAQLGANVKFFSIAGQDQERNFAASILEKYNVDYNFIIDTARPTTLKQRFRSQGRSLLRVSKLSQQAIPISLQNLILNQFEKFAQTFDAIIFSDFNYGCLPQALVDKIITIAKKNKVFIAADSQSSSQVGDISRFVGANLITPTEREARLAIQNFDDGLVVLADKLMFKSKADFILLTLGDEGMISQHADSLKQTPHTEKLDALNPQPIDVSGAGDSVLTTASLALACGGTLWEATLLGNIAAFIQVGRVGNIPLTKSEFLQALS